MRKIKSALELKRPLAPVTTAQYPCQPVPMRLGLRHFLEQQSNNNYGE
jgi:hypothetical protein